QDRQSAKKLEELGYEVVYKEKKGGGHVPNNDENPEIFEFFTKHPRDPWAKKLVFLVRGKKTFENLWLEVPVEREGTRVEAEVKEGNVIEIKGTSRARLRLSDALVDLDQEIVVSLDGKEAFRGKVERRLTDLVTDLRERFDRAAPAWALLEVAK
ncbi:MAG: hypothetical protein ACYTDY_10610, partial [Planctomycetota bacterium]